MLDWVRPLGEGDDDSLQGFADVVVEPVVVAESLIPRPHKVTVRVLQHLHQAHHRQHSVLPSGVSHTHARTQSLRGPIFKTSYEDLRKMTELNEDLRKKLQ